VRERTRARQRGWPRPIASARAIVATWMELKSTTFQLRVGDTRLLRRSPLVVIANGEYELDGLRVGRRRTVSDSALSLYVAPHSSRLEALALPFRVLLGRLKKDPEFEIFRAATIQMDSGRPVTIALDGELTTMNNPLHFSVRPRALRVLVPRPKEA
jgi:diacylglycerol kinase family enzyme